MLSVIHNLPPLVIFTVVFRLTTQDMDLVQLSDNAVTPMPVVAVYELTMTKLRAFSGR